MSGVSATLESILERILVPDNTVIQQATNELREAFKRPSFVEELCLALRQSGSEQIRQVAAVLLRRRIIKQWPKLPVALQHSLREELLKALVEEKSHIVLHAVAEAISIIARHDLAAQTWPQLLPFLEENIKSNDSKRKQMGMMVLSCLSENATEQMAEHLAALLAMFSAALDDREDIMVPHHTIRAMTALVGFIGNNEEPTFRGLVPKVMEVITQFAACDEDKACEALELFDEMTETEVAILVPHLKSVVEFTLKIAGDSNLGDSLRVKALSFIILLTEKKRRALVKHKLVPSIIPVLFALLASETDEDDFDDLEEDAEASTPKNVAAQAVDTLALYVVPDKLIPHLMSYVEPSIRGSNPHQQRAALVTLGCIAEGCSEYLKKKHMDAMLQCVVVGMHSSERHVQSAAMFALGQFSEFLQPEVSRYHAKLVPLLFGCLRQVSQTSSNDESLMTTRIYYALEMFCENLESELLAYLPQLMEVLLTNLKQSGSIKIRELSLSSIGAIANAAKESMLPYFQSVMEQLNVYLSIPVAKETLDVQIQALDTLAVLARTIGPSNFMPLAEQCIVIGLQKINEIDDPDLQRCAYGLFGSISFVMKSSIVPHLIQIIPLIKESIVSTAGVEASFQNGSGAGYLAALEEESITSSGNESDNDDENQDNFAGFNVENAYLEEKEDSCSALAEIAKNTGPAFLPYVEDCFKAVAEILEYPSDNVKKACVACIGQLCCTAHLGYKETGAPEYSTVWSEICEQILPMFLPIVNTDEDRKVVLTTLEVLEEVLKTVGVSLFTKQDDLVKLTNTINSALRQETACQGAQEDETVDEAGAEEDEAAVAEYDTMLIEQAGDLVPVVAKAVGLQFAPYFESIMTQLLKKTKKQCSPADKSFAVGTLAESLVGLGQASAQFAQPLYPVFLATLADPDAEVRNNAVYGLGLLAANGLDAMLPKYPEVLQALFQLASAEEDRRVLDNICGAVSRMILANPTAVPLEQVLPMLVQNLPLKEDFEENATVFACLLRLFESGCAQLLPHMPRLLATFSQVLGTEQIKEETQDGLVLMVRQVSQQHPQDFEAVLSVLSSEQANKLKLIVAAM